MASHSNVQQSAIIALDLFQLAFFSPCMRFSFSFLFHLLQHFPMLAMSCRVVFSLASSQPISFIMWMYQPNAIQLTMLLSVDVMIFYFPFINDLNLYPV
ncbi:hypothetical protein F5148DRAFT_1270205 [Russula earlei]|uniref:Uncharacterized protein n=1 Tax=Russula earlei TaxID=71964 RepID=A0ACC0TQK3_9AGAM|nr:hypothetical protein F5148DRAFT_1270205 [Russula earlei]